MVQDKKSKKSDHLNVYIITEKGDNHLCAAWDLLPPSNDMKAWAKVKTK